jgi:hypothetical protein
MMRTVFEELLQIPNGFDAGKRNDPFDPHVRNRGDDEYFGRLMIDNLAGEPAPAAMPDQFDWSRLDEEICPAKPVEFVYDWEREFSEVLDVYGMLWRYKPRTFAVEWDEEGNFVDSFTPDFYLPEHDLYVELAPWGYGDFGMNVRKVRMLRDLYSAIKIEVIAGRDYKRVAGWLSELRPRGNRPTANRSEGRRK